MKAEGLGLQAEERVPVALEGLEKIIEAIRSLKFGTVTITVQDSKIIQIDKTEKLRLR